MMRHSLQFAKGGIGFVRVGLLARLIVKAWADDLTMLFASC